MESRTFSIHRTTGLRVYRNASPTTGGPRTASGLPHCPDPDLAEAKPQRHRPWASPSFRAPGSIPHEQGRGVEPCRSAIRVCWGDWQGTRACGMRDGYAARRTDPAARALHRYCSNARRRSPNADGPSRLRVSMRPVGPSITLTQTSPVSD